jgi:phosphoglycolate phosphatase
MKKNYILFDFDGVIADSFNQAFEVNKMIYPHLTNEEYKKRFEGNINDWKKTESEHNEDFNHDVDFYTEYLPRLRSEVKIFPDMEKVIEDLSTQYSLIIVSSELTAPIQELLGKYELTHFFTEIMGNDVHKSKIEKIKMVITKYNTDSKRCIFVTDTLGDIREATHMGVSTIGVSWGFHKHETLMKGKPFRVVDSPKELFDSISKYFNSARTPSM